MSRHRDFMKIAILGSCVTRDIIQFLPNDMPLSLYVARTSFISLASEAVQIKEVDIKIDHAFNKRVVFWDMTKEAWSKLEEVRPDILILDFIDERFDIWKKGNQVVTRSNYLSMSNVENDYLADFELLRRSSESTHDLWRSSCEQVIPRIKQFCNEIVLHRALWAEKYYVNVEVKCFDEEDRQIAITANQWLNSYYDFFMAKCPSAKQINVPSEFCVSNFAHKWGRDYFHYGDSYYKKLSELVSER